MLILMLEKLNWFCFNTSATDVKIDRSVLDQKLSFKILGLTFPSKLDWGSYITFIAKTASKKIEALIRSIKFLSPVVALYLGLVLLVATWKC